MKSPISVLTERSLLRAFDRLVARGSLEVRFASGEVRRFGDGSEELITVQFVDSAAERSVLVDPALKIGEMYMEGRLRIERGSVYDLLALFKRNGLRRGLTLPATALHARRLASNYARRARPPDESKRNVAHHYDLDERLFRLFLDEDLQYTCAYFESADQSLDQAQLAKKRHVTAKLLLEPGHRVLDLGCGWGGLALYLADVAGANATGVNLSQEQVRVAAARARERKLSARVRFERKDYRHVTGQFDRIVSVGLLEHVGPGSYPDFFLTIASRLDKRGVAVVHSIGRTKPFPAPTPFMDKYIFPGAYIPAVSEVLPHVEKAGLLIKDIEILPLHYATTLRHWRERFLAERSAVLELFDERFLRMWEFYLAASEVGFRHDRLFIFQLQLARHQDAVPIRRDYLTERARALKATESKRPAYRHLHG